MSWCSASWWSFGVPQVAEQVDVADAAWRCASWRRVAGNVVMRGRSGADLPELVRSSPSISPCLISVPRKRRRPDSYRPCGRPCTPTLGDGVSPGQGEQMRHAARAEPRTPRRRWRLDGRRVPVSVVPGDQPVDQTRIVCSHRCVVEPQGVTTRGA